MGRKGQIAHNKGKSPSEEVRAKMSVSAKKRCTLEWRTRMSAVHKGKKLSPEHCINLSVAQRGRIGPNRGKIMSAEQKGKISASMKRQITPDYRARMSACQKGEKNHQWLGGLSMVEYGWDFTDELKEEVRRRDNHTCQICSVPQTECREDLHCHHVDYDKTNSDPVNLIALCRRCHTRTNHNRPHWTAFFQKLILQKSLSQIGLE